MNIWSTTDYPCQCLLDIDRTSAFRRAIEAVVKPGDIVVDAGAGTGILSFFAAKAGAKKVLAIEIDPVLISTLKDSIRQNNLGEIVTVVEGNAVEEKLPKGVDVFLCELIETGLADELQVPVINRMIHDGVIGKRTKLIPTGYQATLEIGYTDFSYYGFKILAPRHEWPHYQGQGMLEHSFEPVSSRIPLPEIDFSQAIDPDIDIIHSLQVNDDLKINALRLSGAAILAPNMILGATNSLNGQKILPLEERTIQPGEEIKIRIRYRMGAGLSSFCVSYI